MSQLELDVEQNLGECHQPLVLDWLWLIAGLREEYRDPWMQMWGNHVNCLRYWGTVREEWSSSAPMSQAPPPHSSLTGLLVSWRENWLRLVSPFPPLIFLVHLPAFTPAEILSKQSCLCRLFSSCFAFSLLALSPSNPHPFHWIAEEWDRAGVALVFCFEMAQAEVHQQEHSLPGLNGAQTEALLCPCRVKL